MCRLGELGELNAGIAIQTKHWRANHSKSRGTIKRNRHPPLAFLSVSARCLRVLETHTEKREMKPAADLIDRRRRRGRQGGLRRGFRGYSGNSCAPGRCISRRQMGLLALLCFSHCLVTGNPKHSNVNPSIVQLTLARVRHPWSCVFWYKKRPSGRAHTPHPAS